MESRNIPGAGRYAGYHRLYISGHNRRGTAKPRVPKRGRHVTLPPPDYPLHGFCLCGCGGRTAIATATRPGRASYRGFPRQYIRGHNRFTQGGTFDPRFKGRQMRGDGYVLIYAPYHPEAIQSPPSRAGYVLEHRYVWEETHGRRLRPDEVVHHVDGRKANNVPENLVALTTSVHSTHHARHRAPISDAARRNLADATRRAWAEGRRTRRERCHG